MGENKVNLRNFHHFSWRVAGKIGVIVLVMVLICTTYSTANIQNQKNNTHNKRSGTKVSYLRENNSIKGAS